MGGLWHCYSHNILISDANLVWLRLAFLRLDGMAGMAGMAWHLAHDFVRCSIVSQSGCLTLRMSSKCLPCRLPIDLFPSLPCHLSPSLQSGLWCLALRVRVSRDSFVSQSGLWCLALRMSHDSSVSQFGRWCQALRMSVFTCLPSFSAVQLSCWSPCSPSLNKRERFEVS